MIETPEQRCKFEEIYYTYRKRMHYVAYSILKDDTLAEDAVQDALIGIINRIDDIQIDNEKMLTAYILTAVRNAALQINRKHAPEVTMELNLLEYTTASSPDEKMIYEDTVQGIKNALKQLPIAYREILMLRNVYHMEYEDIAIMLNKSQDNVRQMTSRAKRMLEKICTEEGVLDGI